MPLALDNLRIGVADNRCRDAKSAFAEEVRGWSEQGGRHLRPSLSRAALHERHSSLGQASNLSFQRRHLRLQRGILRHYAAEAGEAFSHAIGFLLHLVPAHAQAGHRFAVGAGARSSTVRMFAAMQVFCCPGLSTGQPLIAVPSRGSSSPFFQNS
jgi:hypothetical protein